LPSRRAARSPSARRPGCSSRRCATPAAGTRGPTVSRASPGRSPSGPASRRPPRSSRSVSLTRSCSATRSRSSPPTWRSADNEIAELRRYLSYGGFLLVDDASATRGGAFEQSARQIVSRIVPGAQLSRVPRDHVLYKSFYLLDGPSGRAATTPDLEGLELAGRLAVLYSGNDLIGALARDALGTWEFEVTPGGELQREKSIRLGVNVAMYALCLDYKEDQVHIPFIMKRRRI